MRLPATQPTVPASTHRLQEMRIRGLEGESVVVLHGAEGLPRGGALNHIHPVLDPINLDFVGHQQTDLFSHGASQFAYDVCKLVERA